MTSIILASSSDVPEHEDDLPPIPDGDGYARARLFAQEFKMVSRIRQKLDQQFGAWERFDVVIPQGLAEWRDQQDDHLEAMQTAALRACAREWKGTKLAAHVAETLGLGNALFVVLSLAPYLGRFDTPSRFWKYIGLHAGRATDRKYSAQLKAWALFRVAEPCMKSRQSPYRAVYDRRKSTRPEMLAQGGGCDMCDAAYAKRKETKKAGWDCHNMGGPHYKAAHAHLDALGVTAKAVMLDAWRIAHDLEPKYRGRAVTSTDEIGEAE